jgi:hypothetical protein
MVRINIWRRRFLLWDKIVHCVVIAVHEVTKLNFESLTDVHDATNVVSVLIAEKFGGTSPVYSRFDSWRFRFSGVRYY